MNPELYRYMSERKLLRQYRKLVRAYEYHTQHGWNALAAGYIPKIQEVAKALDALYEARARLERMSALTEGY